MTDFMIKALKAAQAEAEKNMASAYNEPLPIWRNRSDEWVDKERLAREAYEQITGQIIDLEMSMIDPVQYQERYMEIGAEMALTGVKGDPSDYLMTPEQERLFQEQIRHQLDYGYYDEDGYYNEGLYCDPKSGCQSCDIPIWEDELMVSNDHFLCPECNEESIGFAMFLTNFFPNSKFTLRLDRWSEFSDWGIVENE